MYNSEFSKKIMNWLKSNEPTMIDNEGKPKLFILESRLTA